ncbi:MAG: DUF3791 domain-containing protein [Prevotellaceae bacterium]|jgi:hypothetical protein|nr:DUF3791 domain-containing protein [Prevotellaceae bacterium]
MSKKMLEKARDVIDYIAFMVNDFAEKYKLSMRQSFEYLYNYGGIAFLDRHYDIEHCENPAITVRTLQQICSRNGGNL